MNEKTKTTPKDFFLHLLMIVTLYGSVISGLVVIFQSINLGLPDLLEQYRYSGSIYALRSGLAAFIIMFPAYLAVMWGLLKSYKKNDEKRHLAIRRWLIYFTLFVGSIVAIVDLIVVLNSFLNGEITLRFILKALSVFIIIGIALLYYVLDLKKEPKQKVLKNIKWLSIILATLLVIVGFLYSGSPGQARQEGFDEQRVRDLQQIYWSIQNYTQEEGHSLPTDLNILASQFLSPVPGDPETNEPYIYEIIDETNYRLCATFSKPSREEPGPDEWKHPAGKYCFEQSVLAVDQNRLLQKPLEPPRPAVVK